MKVKFTRQNMKTIKLIKSVRYSFYVLFTMLLFNVNGLSNHISSYNFQKNYSVQLPDTKNPVLSLEIVMDNSNRILHVSFNGDEGHEGTLKIYNHSGNLVKESNFELIKSPFYASVDITGLEKGNYKVELTTSKGIHSSNIEIK